MTTLFVGLGMMGAPMVRRYASVYPTIIFDVDQNFADALADELGVRAIPTLSDLPRDVDTIILMLPNSRIVESILDGDAGLISRVPEGGMIVDMGSSEPSSTRDLAQKAAARGIAYVDAPVSGGVTKAVTGELAIMVGGEAADVERAMQHVKPLGTAITFVGPPGAGHAAKALNNLVSATNLAAAAEVLTAAVSFGIKAEVMVDVINSSTGRSQATEFKYPKYVLNDAFDSGFSLDLMLKDIKTARALGEQAGLSMPITDRTVDLVESARNALGAGRDHTEVVRFYEAANQAEIRKQNDKL